MTVNPAKIIREPARSISPGAVACITMIAPDMRWKVTADILKSRSKNTPLLGAELTGQVAGVIQKGTLKYSLQEG